MDYLLFQLINQPQHNFIDLFFIIVSQGSLFVFLASLIPMLFERKKLIPYALIMIVAYFSAEFFKIIIQRPRPEGLLLIAEQQNYSFPSSHASAAGAWTNIMSRFYKKYAKIFWIFGLLVCFSRIYVGVHYPSDVIVGLIWGYVISWFVLKHAKDFFKPLRVK